MFGTVLKLLLLKDLKTSFRQKKLLIIEIIFLFFILPGVCFLYYASATFMFVTGTNTTTTTPSPIFTTTINNNAFANDLLFANGLLQSSTPSSITPSSATPLQTTPFESSSTTLSFATASSAIESSPITPSSITPSLATPLPTNPASTTPTLTTTSMNESKYDMIKTEKLINGSRLRFNWNDSDVNEEDLLSFLKKAKNCWNIFEYKPVESKIVVDITNLTSESFEYKLILKDLVGYKWHNEPHMVPDVFGYPAASDMFLYTFSENAKASDIQFCLNKAYFASIKKFEWEDVNKLIQIEIKPIREIKAELQDYVHCIHMLKAVFPVLINIPILITAHKLCEEKENNIHTFMVVMGLDRSLFILSHLIFAFIRMYLYVLPIGIAAVIYFEEIGWLIFLLLFLFSHAAVSSIFVISSLTKNASSSMILIGFWHIFHGIIVSSVFKITSASILSFLLPQMALSMGLAHLENVVLYGQPVNFFDAPYYLPLYVPVFALLFQAIFLLIVAFYFDAVIPTDDSPKKHPLFFIGMKFDNIAESLKETERQSLLEEFSQQPKNDAFFENVTNEMEADVDVFHLTKKWSKNKFGVQDITFKAYKNQVTAILGHNGAGKSTTFSILSGLTKATYGKAFICGQEPRTLSNNQNVGFCPQWDPLFPHLTIREHLSFYQILKGVDDPQEIDEMITKLGLNDFVHYRAKFLNAGVKRKLCVGMAMIGNSKVIILDEPTHSMDTLSRKQLIEIIRTAKSEHTILLATHYMNEADAVSDRIIILSNGKVICNGSSNFLKSKFITGFLLTIDFTNAIGPESFQEFAEAVLSVVTKNCKDAKIDGTVHQQFKIFLPHGSQKLFPLIFDDLEFHKDGLQINSFDIGTNTLEQVFIKVTDESEPNKTKDVNESIKEFSEKREESETNFGVFISQVFGLLVRKFHYTRRHYIRSAIPYFFLLIFIAFYLLVIFGTKVQAYQNAEKTSISTYPEISIFCYPKNECFPQNFSENVYVFYDNHTVTSMNPALIFENRPLAFGMEKNGSSSKIFYRNGFPNGVPVALTTIFNYFYFGEEKIKTTILIESDSWHFSQIENLKLAIVFFSILFPIIFAIPVFLHVEEIGQGILHLYQRTQMSLFTYWFASLIFDFIYAFIPILIQVIIFVYFDVDMKIFSIMEEFVIALLLISLIFLLQSYVTSLFFTSSVVAVSFLMFYNILLSILCYLMMQAVDDLYLIYPAICFPVILMYLFFISSNVDNKDELYGFCMTPDNPNELELSEHNKRCLGTFYVIVIGNILFYLTVFLVWNFRRYIFSCQKSPNDLTPYKENEDVLEEKRKVESLGPDAFEIYTLNLRKSYSGLVAVRDITMGISKGECFGLLGANGAGKSTFFNMLTALMKPSCGTGFVGGIDIRKQPLFGFCPQTSRFIPELTVEETLYFFARMKGILLKKEFIQVIVEAFYLNNIKNTRTGKLTGGELRRLSIAIAIITSSEIIMLDEPTTGVDPRTRRHIWELLIALRTTGSSQLLTSHSMEECEALCTKIGFINHGVFIGIGTSQHLKYRFGYTHRLTIVLNGPNEALAVKLNFDFQTIFNAIPISVTGNVPDLIWSIPKTSESLSQLYTRLNQFVEAQPKEANGENPIKDYSIVGTSLEEVFATMVDTKIQYEFRF